jgi:WD40 repeat protein
MICSQKVLARAILWLALFVLLLSACQGIPTTTKTPTATLLAGLASRTPSPSATQKDPATPTIPMEPQPEATETPFPTKTPDPPGLSLTSIPTKILPITQDRLDQVEHLAVWGNGAAEELALAADGNLLLVGTTLGVYVYDSFDFRFYTLLRSGEPVRAIAPSPDNEMIAVLEGQDRLAVYNQAQFEKITEINLSKDQQIRDSKPILFFSPKSDTLTLLNESAEKIDILLWEAESWELQSSFSVNAGMGNFVNPEVGVLGVITNENLILHSLTLPGDVRILPLPNQDIENLPDRLSSSPQPIIPAKDGDFLLLNFGDTVAHWDITKDAVDFQLEPYPQVEEDPCESVADTCRDQDGDFSSSCKETSTSTKPPIILLAITPDDQRMLISLDSGRTELRSTYSGDLIWKVDQGYTKVLFSLEYRFLLGLRPNGMIEKLDLLDGELLRTFKQHPTRLYDLDFSPDGSLLAAGFNDEWIRFYSAQTGEMLGILEGSAQTLRFSPNGETLAAGLVDGALQVFQLNLGRSFNLGSGHQGSVTGLAFSQDGTDLLSTGLDCTISRWDTRGRYRINYLVPFEQNPFQFVDLVLDHETDIAYAAGELGILAIDGDQMEMVFSTEPGDKIEDLAVTWNGQMLAAGGSALWLFETSPSGWQIVPIDISPSSETDAFRVAFLPETTVLLAVDQENLSFYSVNQPQQAALLHQVLLPPTLGVAVDLAVSSHGDLIAIGSDNGLIHLFGIP